MEVNFCSTCGAKRVRDVKQELSKLFANTSSYQPDMCAICLGAVSSVKLDRKASNNGDVTVKEECVSESENGANRGTERASLENKSDDKDFDPASSGSDTDSYKVESDSSQSDDEYDNDVKKKKRKKKGNIDEDGEESKEITIKQEGLKTDYHSTVADMDPKVAVLIEESDDPQRCFKCKFCMKTFTYIIPLLHHAITHPGVETFKKPFKCGTCEATFNRRYNLKSHRRMHSEDRPFQCDFPSCQLSFKDKHILAGHKETHTLVKRPRPHQCQVCSKRFQKHSSLVRHALSHSGDKPHMCKFCGFRCTQKGNLTRHEQQHTEEKPYQCTYCSKRFYQRVQLQTHELDHTGDRPFVCEICGHASKTKYNLKQHIYIHTAEKTFKCDKCDFTSKWRENLRIHLEITHSTKRDFQCHLCSQLFKHKDSYTKHIKRHSADASWIPRVTIQRKQRQKRTKATQELDVKQPHLLTRKTKYTQNANTASIITSPSYGVASRGATHDNRVSVVPPSIHQGFPSMSNILYTTHQQMTPHQPQTSTQIGIPGHEPVDVIFNAL